MQNAEGRTKDGKEARVGSREMRLVYTTLHEFVRVCWEDQCRQHPLWWLVHRNASWNRSGTEFKWMAGTSPYDRLVLPWGRWTERFEVTATSRHRPCDKWREHLFREIAAGAKRCCQKLKARFLHDLIVGEGGLGEVLGALQHLVPGRQPRKAMLGAVVDPWAMFEKAVTGGANTCLLGTRLKRRMQATSVGRYLEKEADWSGATIHGLQFLDCSLGGMQHSYLFPRDEFRFAFLTPSFYYVSGGQRDGTQQYMLAFEIWGTWYPRKPALFTIVN